MFPVDGPAYFGIMIIEGNPLVIPAEFIGKRSPQSARPDDGNSARI
jgi:hypothetical protein